MWSEYSLEVVDAVARNGSFSAAAQELHRVPSAVSSTSRCRRSKSGTASH
ncbi:LysR family transcriptional regulator, partial [Escherichia sp. TWPC-MK]